MPAKKRVDNGSSETKQRKRRKKAKEVSESEEESPEKEAQTEINDSPDDVLDDVTLDPVEECGELLYCGGTNWDTLGRNKPPAGVKNAGGPMLWAPHRVSTLSRIKINALSVGCSACHCIAITTEGRGYSWGRNEKGQLGQGDTTRRNSPTLLSSLDDHFLIAAASGKNHTLLLTRKGRVLSCGDNKMGQLGQGHQSAIVPSPTYLSYKGTPLCKIACGAEFSMVADVHGRLYSFGCPEYGQLGNNTDGKYFVSSTKLSFKCELQPRRVRMFMEKSREGHVVPITDVVVKEIACGINHTIVLDDKKRIFTWGFGGYGRLGHSEPKDEMVPRLLKSFTGQGKGGVKIRAGSSFSMALNEYGAVFLWGQTKSAGEANMYPKCLQDFNGWKVRDFSCCNKSIAVVADDSVITWGSSPTFGELGYGENKPHSSTTPTELKTLPGVYVHSVSCGYAFTMLLARSDSDADREAIDNLPVFDP